MLVTVSIAIVSLPTLITLASPAPTVAHAELAGSAGAVGRLRQLFIL